MRARAPRIGAARSAGVQPCPRVVAPHGRRRPVRCAAAGAPDDPYAALDRTPKTLTLRIGESEVTVETGRIGRQANGAVMVTEGETVIYATICAGRDVTADGGFVPLTVNYQERYSAVGRTAGGYRKRDGGVRENETLIGRLVDRPLRPMIPKGWAYDTQILEWVLSYDGERSTDALAITAASAAAAISDVPLKKPIAGVRVGLLPGETEPLINPTCEQMERSRLDLVLAGTEDAVMMIEGFGDFLTVEEMLYAVEKGHEAVASACRDIEAWAKDVGRVKNEAAVLVAPEGVDDAVRALVGAELAEAMAISVKQTRGAAVEGIRARAIESLAGGDDAKFTESDVRLACGRCESNALRSMIRANGVRQDGRDTKTVRPITCSGGLLPRTHGSSLFTRGETQAIAATTLGGATDAQKVDGLGNDKDRRFYLHYFFPPSSVGETGRVGAANRREVGHGNLAERALMPVIPPYDDFPFTVRLESTITESNGSSSMATVCAGSLALQDAGVPITRKVAGIAMGLILGDESAGEAPVILTDILGSEDALGDMDFKVAGDGDGISAFQMDIKVEGITLAVLREALESARGGLVHILGEMDKADPAPAGRMSAYAPQVEVVEVPQKYIGKVIGKGGEQIKAICEQTKIDTIDINEEGVVTLTGSFGCDMPKAVEIIRSLTVEPEVGKTYRNARVTKVLDFGAFVEILPGVEGLCHVSELDVTRVANVRDVVEEGQTIDVKLLETNERGQFKLSRRAVLLDEGGEKVRRELAEAKVAAGGDDAEDAGKARGKPPPKARRGRSRLRE